MMAQKSSPSADKDARAELSAAIRLANTGQIEEARDSFQKYLKDQGSEALHEEAFFHWARMESEFGNRENAENLWAEFQKRYPDSKFQRPGMVDELSKSQESFGTRFGPVLWPGLLAVLALLTASAIKKAAPRFVVSHIGWGTMLIFALILLFASGPWLGGFQWTVVSSQLSFLSIGAGLLFATGANFQGLPRAVGIVLILGWSGSLYLLAMNLGEFIHA